MVGATRCQIWSCRADKARAWTTNALKSAPRMEPLLQAGVYALWPYSGAILLRLRCAAIENNHARSCQLQTDEYGDASRSVS